MSYRGDITCAWSKGLSVVSIPQNTAPSMSLNLYEIDRTHMREATILEILT